MLSRKAPVLLGLAGSLFAASTANAGTITLDRTCYIERTAMVVSGSGFTPGGRIVLSGDGAFGTADADATGTFVTTLQVPYNTNLGARSSDIRVSTLKAENYSAAADNTSINYQITNFAYSVSDNAGDPRKKRTFYLAGFPENSNVWAHYRFGGKTRGNVKFGKAKGACGLVKTRQALLPSSIKMRYGQWKVQWDTKKSYKATTKPRLTTGLTTYRTFSRR
ncbi:MAG TPA: hypothetical protein PKB03_02740 [Baekduia sp.]|nr:hypothetical protein [Baekduia sp.]